MLNRSHSARIIVMGAASLGVGVASCVMLYLDHRLMGAGTTFANGMTFFLAWSLQPWLLFMPISGQAEFGTWSRPEMISLGLLSGATLAGAAHFCLRRWPALHLAAALCLLFVAGACVYFAREQEVLLERIRVSALEPRS